MKPSYKSQTVMLKNNLLTLSTNLEETTHQLRNTITDLESLPRTTIASSTITLEIVVD